MGRLITQKNQPPRPKGGFLLLVILLVVLCLALLVMFTAGLARPMAVQAAVRATVSSTALRLPSIMSGYGAQTTLARPTWALTQTVEITADTQLVPGMTIDSNYPPQISTQIGDVGQYNADYYLGVIELVGKTTVWPYWHVRLYAGTDTFDGYMLEPSIYQASIGHLVVRAPRELYRVHVKANNHVYVRQQPTDGQIMGRITDPAVDYAVIGYVTEEPYVWLQVRNPELGSWDVGWVAGDFFDRAKPAVHVAPAQISLDLLKTEGQAVRVRGAAGTLGPIVGRIINPLMRYETVGGVQLGAEYWHKVINPYYKAGDRDNEWKEGYVLSDFFIEH